MSLIYAPVDAIVRFVNLDDEAHELFRRFEGQMDGVVDGVVAPGEALELIFTEPGQYRYRCRIHAKSWSLYIQPLDTFRP